MRSDDPSGQKKEREVVLRLLALADQQAMKPVQPVVRALGHPAARFRFGGLLLRFSTAGPEVRSVVRFNYALFNLRLVTARE